MATKDLLLFDLELDESTATQRDDIPHIIKYMGSKKPIIDFVVSAIHDIHIPGRMVCDLFAGSCSVSAALRKKYDFISNDIQDYSRILAHAYFSDLGGCNYQDLIKIIEKLTQKHVAWFQEKCSHLFFDYGENLSLKKYQKIELQQRNLLEQGSFDVDYHLFSKYYAGTYWSFEQCVWIDALRKAAEGFTGRPEYYAILASIMYGMSYTTQSTGHFAQYRDGDTESAMKNILTYRRKNIFELFKKKLKQLVETLDNSLKTLQTTTLSFEECLKNIPEMTTVYADPPYAPVHYSRFYHALETLVKYDYPSVDHKGRYRSDRHQSPFSQKGNALQAFGELFSGTVAKNAQMILSYSGSGVAGIHDIQELANEKFPHHLYDLSTRTLDHKHSTMGRFEDHERDVVEYLIIARLKQA